MKQFFKHPIVVAVLIFIAVILTCIIVTTKCTHEVTCTGTVISHNVTSNRYGDITYYTVARFEDGTIRSISGLKFYVKEIGSTIHYTQTELNK
jgi:hypothetical protein